MDPSLLAGGVAVITGSATGLGLAVAEHAAALGMHVCLADLRSKPLAAAAAKLAATHPGIKVAGIVCDVTDRASMATLAEGVASTFDGAPVRYLGANAGVLFPAATVLTGSASEWNVTMNVNVIGVVNTVQAFVPVMLAHELPCVVVNTASTAGLVTGFQGPYGSSKHACVALSEALHQELAGTPGGERIHVHVLCPSLVNTPLMYTSSEVNMANKDIAGPQDARADAASAFGVMTFAPDQWAASMTPEYVANAVFEGVQRGEFYIIVGQGERRALSRQKIKSRHDGIQASPTYHQTFSLATAEQAPASRKLSCEKGSA